jgi:MoxR-like ATPase
VHASGAARQERLDATLPVQTLERIVTNIKRVIHAPDEVLRLCVMALIAEGHVILEDAPGVGKTQLAKALARSVDLRFARAQFTPDLLPSDVTGVSVFSQKTNEFEFRRGPVFTDILLVDEINRASPKTQAALLECMQERQVTVDGITYPLTSPFMVIATQNPIDYEGTYPLPEAQLDRFMMLLHLGYPELAAEASMLAEQAGADPLSMLTPVADEEAIQTVINAARAIFVDESLNRYVVALLHHTRDDDRLLLGASPRAGIAVIRVAKARALTDGREYVTPDDVKAVAVPVLSHRVILTAEARTTGVSGAQIIADALRHTPVPL